MGTRDTKNGNPMLLCSDAQNKTIGRQSRSFATLPSDRYVSAHELRRQLLHLGDDVIQHRGPFTELPRRRLVVSVLPILNPYAPKSTDWQSIVEQARDNRCADDYYPKLDGGHLKQATLCPPGACDDTPTGGCAN